MEGIDVRFSSVVTHTRYKYVLGFRIEGTEFELCSNFCFPALAEKMSSTFVFVIFIF